MFISIIVHLSWLSRITVSFAKFYNTELLLAKSLNVKKFAEMKEKPRLQSVLNQDLPTGSTFGFKIVELILKTLL